MITTIRMKMYNDRTRQMLNAWALLSISVLLLPKLIQLGLDKRWHCDFGRLFLGGQLQAIYAMLLIKKHLKSYIIIPFFWMSFCIFLVEVMLKATMVSVILTVLQHIWNPLTNISDHLLFCVVGSTNLKNPLPQTPKPHNHLMPWRWMTWSWDRLAP